MADIPERCDVLVAGAGPAGLIAAGLLAAGGAATVLAGPAGGSAGDTRTTALFGGAGVLLRRLGVAVEATPLRALRIVDRMERDDLPSRLVFEAAEIGLAAFGANYRNADLVAELERRIAGLPALRRAETTVIAYEHADDCVRATLGDGTAVRARLVVAADGRRSPAREAAGIAAKVWDYGQTALAFQIGHSAAHDGVSTEIHRPGGPLTVIPLAGNRSAVNWLLRPGPAAALAALDDDAFAAELGRALGGLFGEITDVGRRAAWPVQGLSVSSLGARRTVLVGEAAHVLPPIGAQGLNLGFRDAAAIAGLAADAIAGGRDPGAADVLGAYRAARRGDVLTRRAATDLLNRSLLFGPGVVRGLRGVGLTVLAASGHARRALMREGLVREGELPPLMREPAPP
jgi:2-octaprenyl-6-methoxyphenol hydroxylase